MVVKAVRGRRRYVVYRVPQETGRTEVLTALEKLAETMPDIRVITSFEGKAIVRCSPSEIVSVSEAMRTAFPGSDSLIASGTLRKVREIYPELRVAQKKKR